MPPLPTSSIMDLPLVDMGARDGKMRGNKRKKEGKLRGEGDSRCGMKRKGEIKEGE